MIQLPAWVIDAKDERLTRLVRFDVGAQSLAGFIGEDEGTDNRLAQYLIRWAHAQYGERGVQE